MKVSIYTAYHRRAPLLASPQVVPIHVGRAQAAAALAGMIGDDTGDNISSRNTGFCELTALYWAWKNDITSDMIGLMHYRRLLDLGERAPQGEVEKHPGRFDIPDWLSEVDTWARTEAQKWDIVVSRPHFMGRGVRENYEIGHIPQDFAEARRVINRDFPAYLSSFDEIADNKVIRLGNLAIMSRPMLDKYCEFLFGVLFAIEGADLNRDFYSPYQKRYLGFLGERLLSVFVHNELKANPTLRLKSVSILNLSETLVTPYLAEPDPAALNAVNICVAADRTYLPHCAAMVRSLIDHADKRRPINLFLLHSGIKDPDLALLAEVVRDHPLAQLHPINAGNAFAESYRSASRAPSNVTYFRFLIFDLFAAGQKVLYLDCDIIIRANICKLYDTDMGDAVIAGVPDWIMTRTLTGPVPTIDPAVPDLAVYHRQTLGLDERGIARYLNAGVMLFNLGALDDPRAVGRTLCDEAARGKYLFRDQDILNKTFKDQLMVLDARWNVSTTGQHAYGKVPAAGVAAAMSAKADPWILHYADRDHKPWLGQATPYSQYYWDAALRTPFFGETLIGSRSANRFRLGSRVVSTGKKLADAVPVLKGPLLTLHRLLRRFQG